MPTAVTSNRRHFIQTLAAGAVPLRAARASMAQPNVRRPNIVVILTDDQGWGDLSVHGNTNLATPHIDSLARDGARLDNFYVCAVCAPTRAEFLTGRYHPRTGVRGVTTGAERLNLDERTIGQVFQEAGYATGAFGKWHNGSQHPYHPNARGFGEYYGFTSGHWGTYFDPQLDHNGELVRGQGFIADDLTNHAIRFIEQNRAKAFFCYLPLNTPHSPMQVPDRFYSKFADFNPTMTARDTSRENLSMTRAALAMCENVDWNAGRVLAALDRMKLAENTIVFYFSDNGPNSWRWNGGMKGIKGSLDEGGLRSPGLMRWPGRIRPGTRIRQIAGAIDLLPTFAELAGVPARPAKPLDGRSLQPLLLGSAEPWPERTLFSAHNGRVSARDQRFRLDPAGRLYDLDADPGQDRDAATEHPAEAARLRKAADSWKQEVLPGPDTRPYPVGYSAVTRLSAQDGVAHGKIERSSQHPNHSFFRNWRSPEDSITWDIEVARAGRYEATLHYTCPPVDTGSTIELSFESRRTAAKVGPAWDPPLIGTAADRSPRSESLVKDFRPLVLGLIDLPKTRGLLTLRATEIRGSQAADVFGVSLKLLN